MSTDPEPDDGLEGAVRLRPLLFALLLVSLLGALNLTIVAASLATIAGDLGGVDRIAWTVSAYALGSTVALPILGQLADIRGSRPLFLLSLVTFLVGSVLCGLSTSIELLAGARLIQGVGGAGTGLLSQTILAEVLPSRRRARSMALLGSVFAIATVAGPVLGGLITDTVGWRWIFFASVPFGAIALMVSLGAIPSLPPPRPEASLDTGGAVSLTVALSALVLALSLGGGTVGWSSPAMFVLAVAAVAGSVVFVAVERRVPLPMVPFVMFRDRVVVMATVLAVVAGVGLLSVVAFLPAYVQMRYAVPAAVAGAIEVAIVAGLLAASNLAGYRLGRTGRYRWYPIAGNAVAAAAIGTVAVVAADVSMPALGVLLLLVGAGVGAYMQIAIVLVQNQAPRQFLGVATSTVNLIRQMGITIATAIIGGVFGASAVRRLEGVALPGGVAASDVTPQLVRRSDAGVRRAVADAYAGAMAPILAALALVFLLGLVMSIVLPTVELEDVIAPEPGAGNVVTPTAG